jgi:long-chain acyl-CoA synthetase
VLLSEQLIQAAAKNLSRPAYRYLGKETSYADLRNAVGRLSYLYQHDLGTGARVAFLARNSPAVITTFFALTNVRAITIPMNPDAPPEELVAWLKDCHPTHLAVTGDLIGTAREILGAARLSIPVIEIEKKQGGEYDTSFKAAPDHKPLDTDPVLLLRTAGAGSGRPRFVTLGHKQLQHAALGIRGIYRLQPADRVLTPMSWHHPFAFVHGMILPLLNGATCVIHHGLEAVEFLDFLVESRVTRLVATPSQLLKTLVSCRNEKRGLPGLRSVTVGLGQLSPELRKAFTLLKVQVSHCYGQTENAWTLAMEELPENGAVAEAPPAGARGLAGLKYKVMDEQGDEIPGKEERIGHLAVTGPTVMAGYHELEKETKSVLRGTWLYTGDLARLTGDGEELRIQYLGRRDDQLVADGRVVPLARVDQAARHIAGIQDAAAVVVRNAKGEPRVVAAVVKVKGSALTEKQVLESLGAALTPDLVPRAVAFIDQIPRDAGGNVVHARLRGQLSHLAG